MNLQGIKNFIRKLNKVNRSVFSGLDSSSSVQVVSHLKTLAHGGRTVVCVIHQPSSRLFEMFDDVLILVEGQTLYNGSVTDMVPFFESAGYQCPNYYNRADFGKFCGKYA